MPENLLTICQNVADACQLTRPNSVVGNTDETSRLLLSRAKHEIEALARRPDDYWTALMRTFEFNPVHTGTVVSVAGGGLQLQLDQNVTDNSYTIGDVIERDADGSQTTITSFSTGVICNVADAIFSASDTYTIYRNAVKLPSDFKHWIDHTGWNKDTFWSLRGPMTAMEWRHYKHSVLGNSVTLRNRWRILPYYDISGNYLQDALNLDPTPTESQDFLIEYVSNSLVQTTTGAEKETWDNDQDLPILDQYLVELGMIWRTLSRLGLPYAEELDEYEVQVGAAIGRDGGGRVLDLARTTKPSFLSTDNVPDTGIGQ